MRIPAGTLYDTFEKILLQNADVKESLDEANDIIQSMLE